MITVRFPTGFSVQYNELDNADIRANGIYLGKKSAPNNYSVWVPTDCMIEHIQPCRTYFAASPSDESKAEAKQLRHKLELAQRQIRRLKGKQV